jgi:hypothetical protein
MCSAKGSSLASFVDIRALTAIGGSSESVGCRLTGEPALDLVPIRAAKPLGDRARAARPDVMVVDSNDGKNLDGRAKEDYLVAVHQVVDRHVRVGEWDAERARQPQDVPPGHTREDLVALRRPFEAAVLHPEQRRMGGLGHDPGQVDQDRFLAAGAAGFFDRKDVRQQVGRFDVATLPSEVGLSDDPGADLA